MPCPTLYLSREQVRRVDALAIQQYRLPGIVLMENAARAVVDAAAAMLAGRPGDILILCGGGNNGGDGLAVARHLHNRGHAVRIGLTVAPARYQGDALINWNVTQAMTLSTELATPALVAQARWALIIDAIFGTGLAEPPREPFPSLAVAVNDTHVPVLAVDLPSGLDCDTGRPLGVCIRASRTVTFVAMKQGFANPESRQWTGEVTVGDIGCPAEAIGLAVPTREPPP
jgi:NAD(P)H-hydrate epimerase